jgi:hypothetical protein
MTEQGLMPEDGGQHRLWGGAPGQGQAQGHARASVQGLLSAGAQQQDGMDRVWTGR